MQKNSGGDVSLLRVFCYLGSGMPQMAGPVECRWINFPAERKHMIDKTALSAFIEEALEDTDYFMTDLKVTPANEITVEIDSMDRVDIDFCIDLSRRIEEAFSRDEEDYELEVGSAGLTTPFKVPAQYRKHIGDDVEILEKAGKKVRGTLKDADDEGFTVEITEKVKHEGAKRPVLESRDQRYAYPDVKSVVYVLEF